MVYLTEESGRSIGALVATSGMDAEVIVTMEEIVIKLTRTATARQQENKVAKDAKAKTKAKAKTIKSANPDKKRKWREGEKIKFQGESLTRREWAAKLGITESGVSYRLQAHGNPYGAVSPKPSDSDKVVAAS